jgi:hypothetical protein
VGITNGEAAALSETLQLNTGSSYCRWCCNDSKILDGTILAADIAADAVTTAKIFDGTILAADIAADAVTTAKILDGTILRYCNWRCNYS